MTKIGPAVLVQNGWILICSRLTLQFYSKGNTFVLHSVTSFEICIEFFLVCSCCLLPHRSHSQNKKLESKRKVCFYNNKQRHNSDISFKIFIICQAKIGEIFFRIYNKCNFICLSQCLQSFSTNGRIRGTLCKVTILQFLSIFLCYLFHFSS